MKDKTFSLIKLEESPFKYYSDPIRVYCPFCRLSTSRTRTFHSLKSLNTHISMNHKTETHPIGISEVQEILQSLANAIKWEILK